MAKPSKQRPWTVEIQPPHMDGWFNMDAYRDEEEAKANAKLMEKRSPEAKFRVVKLTENAHELWLPYTFWEDHVIGRELPGGAVLKQEGRRRVYVRCNEADLAELESDARHYSDAEFARELGRDYAGLVASARATVRAIQAHRSKSST